jgi:hypothetical protein
MNSQTASVADEAGTAKLSSQNLLNSAPQVTNAEVKEQENQFYRFLIRLFSLSNPHPLPWILMYNQNAEKSSREPRPSDTPLS